MNKFSFYEWLEECTVLIGQARFFPGLRDKVYRPFSNNNGSRKFSFTEDEDKKGKL